MIRIAVRYALRTQKLVMLQQVLVMVYFSAFHSIVLMAQFFGVLHPTA